jgi:hypothetical protein
MKHFGIVTHSSTTMEKHVERRVNKNDRTTDTKIPISSDNTDYPLSNASEKPRKNLYVLHYFREALAMNSVRIYQQVGYVNCVHELFRGNWSGNYTVTKPVQIQFNYISL